MALNKLRFIIVFISLFLIVGCQSEVQHEAMTFQEIYPANLSDVTKIEIRHGGGELKTITDVEIIDDWLNSIKEITFEPDENQEGRVGYTYSVKIFEKRDVKMYFDTSKINDFYYLPNNQIMKRIEHLFNES
ncbi:hypothetical protein M9R32_01790 [Paenisporosarcina quisquiliarum]|uniref:Lipoprotein n=1 Tax=Paenisporosarcina quisquiliarum TaxID=365346 RepID=A0A9X3RBS6_9BACL|nr:hypothetical protein [Paenisporosarcina quisquiliarum]MCZ8535920.1 hypothetical protein [Paenisporosarcina quisquiliarum]